MDYQADVTGISAEAPLVQSTASPSGIESRHAKPEVVREYLSSLARATEASGVPFLSHFDVATTFGTGAFYRMVLVHLNQHHCSKLRAAGEHKHCFALKKVKKHDIVQQKQVEHIMSEKAIWEGVSHPFIVSMYTSFQDASYLYMLLEFVVGGEVFAHLRRMGKFSNNHTRFYVGQIVLALDYLHSENICYRHVKPENLLLDMDGYIKMTDFGFAKKVEDRTWTICGTPEYLAPEIIQGLGHGKAVDWWALGVLMFEMLGGYPPFYDENPFGIYQRVLQGKVELPHFFDMSACHLISKLLTHDLSKRMGGVDRCCDAQVRRHEWFRDLPFAELEAKLMQAPLIPAVEGDDDTEQYEEYPDSVELATQALNMDVDATLFHSF